MSTASAFISIVSPFAQLSIPNSHPIFCAAKNFFLCDIKGSPDEEVTRGCRRIRGWSPKRAKRPFLLGWHRPLLSAGREDRIRRQKSQNGAGSSGKCERFSKFHRFLRQSNPDKRADSFGLCAYFATRGTSAAGTPDFGRIVRSVTRESFRWAVT